MDHYIQLPAYEGEAVPQGEPRQRFTKRGKIFVASFGLFMVGIAVVQQFSAPASYDQFTTQYASMANQWTTGAGG